LEKEGFGGEAINETVTMKGTTRGLASFVSSVEFADLPAEVVERTGELLADWAGSAVAGSGTPPIVALGCFAESMGPTTGPCEVFATRRRTSPLFAALVNGASSHIAEQDDLHNGSVFHPGTVVFPAVLAAAQETGASGREALTAVVAGYEAGIRVGEFLGRSHYRVFHTTGTAGTLAAAAGVSRLLGLDAEATLNSLGSAGTQAAGLWEFLVDAADSKQLHAGKAAADGLLSAYLARDGFTGARRVLEGSQGLAAGTSTDADAQRITDRLGERWVLAETSFKYHASCRHTHPAADALLKAMRDHELEPEDVSAVKVRVHGAAIDVLGPVKDPRTIHQSKFSMGFVLAVAAVRGRAGIEQFTEEALQDPELRDFHDRVEMVLDPEVDAAYPERWIGLVDVQTTAGRLVTSRVEMPKGDPANTLSRRELIDKALRLAAFSGGASEAEMDDLLRRTFALKEEPSLRDLLPACLGSQSPPSG
jgi:2-methylcitrate dehydratase PrpD